jgi:hypothetical protein
MAILFVGTPLSDLDEPEPLEKHRDLARSQNGHRAHV